jgi:hypothetical protein
MHPVVVLAAELARCRCNTYHGSGSSYGSYLFFSWLWREVHWWSLLVYGGIIVGCGLLKAAFGSGSDC